MHQVLPYRPTTVHSYQLTIHVIVVDTHNLAEELNLNIDYIQFDLCKIDEYPHLIEEIENKTHNLKCLINNAAYNPRVEDEHSASGRFEDIQLEGWQDEFLINLTAPVFLIKEMLPLFNVVRVQTLIL